MAKMAKKTQTDYTRGGRDISNTAIPLYQENLTRMGSYLEDPSARTDEYLNKYFTNTPEQNDFLRNYQRTMSGLTGSNYASTHGGYSSANQFNYDQNQRYMNDYLARLYSQGVGNAFTMSNQDYQNMLAGNQAYQNAYQLGKAYSDVQQYNDLVRQNNKLGNQLFQNAGNIGTAVGSIWGPVGGMVGGAIGNTLGSTFSTDVSPALNGSFTEGLGTQNIDNLSNLSGAVSSVKELLPNLFGKAKSSINRIKNRNIFSGGVDNNGVKDS